MKLKYLFLFSLFSVFTIAQELKSPSEFLGYELGTWFTRQHQVVDYFTYLSEAAKDRVQLVHYGKTNEQRELILVYVASANNLKNIETIRTEHLKSLEGNGTSSKAIVWLSYNVHGNESVGTEASMQTIYELLTSKSSYLDNTVVIIDPCLNPDGRDRYVNWYNQYKHAPYQVDPNSVEHNQGWWTGRSNHYMFDLNRDWAWLTQKESQQRLKYYNKWHPHVHVDFHEQGVDNPYYFAPAAEPYHEVITPFQRDFQNTIGKNHAKYFDKEGWFYFTKEVFDLLYPSYGDTYPTYNGSIGMTYEQGGSGRAGLGIITKIGDTLTLKDRIAHHHTTGLSTVEVSNKNAQKLNDEFRKFFKKRSYKYKSFVLQGNNDRLSALKKLLDAHQIEYSQGTNSTVKGFRYKTGATGSLSASDDAIVVSTNQKKATLVKVLFEPKTKLSDSLTYDITAWSLPYAYGLDAVASTTGISGKGLQTDASSNVNLSDTYAYITDWDSMNDARFLADLMKNGIKTRVAHQPFSVSGKQFKRGSLIITKADNKLKSNFIPVLNKIANTYNKEIIPTSTGYVDSGKDFGSDYVKMIAKPKIAVLTGEPTSTLRYGEIWHFFEQQLHFPFTAIRSNYIQTVDFSEYDVLILPEGNYNSFLTDEIAESLKAWVKNGGKLIAMGRAISGLAGTREFTIKAKKVEKDSAEQKLDRYQGTQRNYIQNAITGAIFKTKIDDSHPLAYGYTNEYFTLKLGANAFDYLEKGTVAYIEEQTEPVSGFAGSNAKNKIKNSMVFGVEKVGKGNVIYFVDNPLFRGFWENGKLFFANALFMIP